MNSVSTEGLPDPTLDAYTPKQLITIINNGAQVARTHPQYAQVRQIMTEALANLTQQHVAQNQADSLAALPHPEAWTSGVVNFGQGASLGLLGQNSPIPFLRGVIDPIYLNQARSEHPLASGIGEIAGTGAVAGIASPLVAGLGPATGGALLQGGLGALQGAAESKPGERGTGAIIGGGLGAVGGAVGGKTVSVVGRVGKNAARLLGIIGKEGGGAAAEGAEEKIGNMTVSAVRAALEKKGFTGEALERMVNQARASLAPNAVVEAATPTTTRVQSGGVTTFLTEGKPTLQTEPAFPGNTDIGGTPREGVAVTGAAPPSKPPSAPTVAEIQERLGQARAAFGAHTEESLPQPSAGVSVTPRAAADVSAAKPTMPEPFAATRQIAGAVNQLQEKMGRALTPQEREKVLELLLGPRGARPGHPLWFGGGSPTPRGPILPE